MWNDPGSPWHAQTGAPLLYAYRFLYGAERDRERMDIMWEEEKCFAGQLSKKCPIHYPHPPIQSETQPAGPTSCRHHHSGASWQSGSGRGRPAESWTMASRQGSLWALCVCGGGVGGALLESYIQLKTRSRLFSRDMYIRKTRVGVEQTTALCGLCYIHFNQFPFNQSVWMLKIRIGSVYDSGCL